MGEKLITLSNVSKQYDNNRFVLRNVSLSICKGDFVAVTGPNGGGKTTLLRLILGLIKPSEGTIDFDKSHITFGYLPQKNKIDSQFPITVRELVTQGFKLKAFKKLSDEQLNRISEVIKRVGMDGKDNQPIGQLSGGQLQRALIARAIVSKPKVLVLDEPLSYLDKNFEQELYAILQEMAEDTTIIIVSHEITDIARMASRHLLVADGNITECQEQSHQHQNPRRH